MVPTPWALSLTQIPILYSPLPPAQILCTVDGTPRYYDVEITAVHMDHDNINRGIELLVTDPELLAATGGIYTILSFHTCPHN
mgnify:CR=1 FL=1